MPSFIKIPLKMHLSMYLFKSHVLNLMANGHEIFHAASCNKPLQNFLKF